MTTVGYSTLEVIPSVKGLRSSLEKQTSGDLTAAGRTGGAKFGDAAGKEGASSFRSKFTAGMRGFAPLAGLVGGAVIVDQFRDAIQGASDLAESTTKANVVFGEASASVLEFASNASSALGQSEQQALSAAGTFGNLLRSVDLTEQQAAEFSISLTGLASDLASFNNTTVDEALDALRSGLVGETEPLKRFGVNLNDAALKAQALEMGLSDGVSTLNANAKAQAAYALIMEDTALAQGDFARTSDGLANQQRTLSAQWTEMKTTLGQELLPATTAFVSFLNDQGLPALSAAGGFAKDAVQAFGDLPAPVQAAALAFVALRAASAFGLGDTVSAGAARATSAIDSLRLRTMLYSDAVQSARFKTVEFANTSAQVSTGVGRMSASMAGLRAASAGIGKSMATGLRSVTSLLGGPWGIAIIGATALLTKFHQEQQEAKQRVDDLRATLDKQTGAITERTKAEVASALAQSEALKLTDELGLSLRLVTDAALGNAAAMDELRAMEAAATDATTGHSEVVSSQTDDIVGRSGALKELVEILEDESSALGSAVSGQQDFLRVQDAMTDSEAATAAATDNTTQSLADYHQQIRDTRTELRKLIDAEEERALNAIQQRRDRIALITTLQEAEKEARQGAKTLDTQTKAGQENMTMLLDLADQWSSSEEKVQNARGAYEDMRRDFIRVAVEMGATKERARALADELLKVPKTAPLKFQSEGFRERMAEIRELRREAARAFTFTVAYVNQNLPTGRTLASYAGGGLIGGYGSGTSDSNIIRASRGEFMQPKASVDYYGEAFMEAIRKRMFPRIPGYAKGGMVEPVAAAPMGPSGLNIGHMTVVAQDWRDFVRKGQQKTQAAMSDGVNWG